MTRETLQNYTLSFLLDSLYNKYDIKVVYTVLDCSILILKYNKDYKGIKKLFKISEILDDYGIHDAFDYAKKSFPNVNL